jgi:hypothetical protein
MLVDEMCRAQVVDRALSLARDDAQQRSGCRGGEVWSRYQADKSNKR